MLLLVSTTCRVDIIVEGVPAGPHEVKSPEKPASIFPDDDWAVLVR